VSFFVTGIGNVVVVHRNSRPHGQYASGAAAWAFSLRYFLLWKCQEPESLVQLCVLPAGNGRLRTALRYRRGGNSQGR